MLGSEIQDKRVPTLRELTLEGRSEPFNQTLRKKAWLLHNDIPFLFFFCPEILLHSLITHLILPTYLLVT